MIRRLRSLISEGQSNLRLIRRQSQENVWAAVFHDSIRGKEYLQNLPLNVGRWAGNYSFFYLLNRILMDFRPQHILELGLGESSKFISTYLDNYLLDSMHTIIEHDAGWANGFSERFDISARSRIRIFPLQEIEINGHKCTVYKDLEESLTSRFDLYVIDGPFGSKRFSRFDLMHLVKRLGKTDEFVIIVDDYNRLGERDTVDLALKELSLIGVPHFHRKYEGAKTQIVIASGKYRLATSL